MEYERLNEKQKNQIAKAFDATPELIPFIPYLLQDLFELGSSPEIIINILKSLNLKKDSRILDLACGKGAVSIRVAKELDYYTLGVDLFEPFIAEAVNKAILQVVAELCTFEVEDIAASISTRKDFDVVILASAETLLGNLDSTIFSLRNTVRHGGYIIYDGAYLNENLPTVHPEYSVLQNYAGTRKVLQSYGDEIIREVLIPADETKSINSRYTELILNRAEELINLNPDKKDLLTGYVRKQEAECKIIESEITGCVWCLQKKYDINFELKR